MNINLAEAVFIGGIVLFVILFIGDPNIHGAIIGLLGRLP